GITAGALGETSVPAILLGGLLLLVTRVADWRPVVGMLGTVALMGWAFTGNPLAELMAGAALFGAFFVATDPVTTPLTRWGRFLFRSEEHTSELQSRENLVCRLLLEKKK